jgi:glycosyltransferase involved in cell wall biosynthesis
MGRNGAPDPTCLQITAGLREGDTMQVCLDVSAALVQRAGIGRYARELAIALASLNSDDTEFLLFHNRIPGSLPEPLQSLPRFSSRLGTRAWRLGLLVQSGLPGVSRPHPAFDLFHGMDFIGPRLRQPLVITIHDLSTLRFPQHHTPLNRLFLRFALPIMVRRSAAIIAVSHATRQDVVELLHAPPEQVHVIPNGVDHNRFKPSGGAESLARLHRDLGLPSEYLLALGTLEPRKNLLTLLRAYAGLGRNVPDLVLAGGEGWGRNSPIQEAKRLNILDRLHFTGFVPNELLPDLYRGAALFVYPSLYEGFGLPVLEAMASGTPVIASNTSSLPELVGDSGLLVPPLDTRALADAIDTVLEDSELAARLARMGRERSLAFSWERTARETMEVYSNVLDTRS